MTGAMGNVAHAESAENAELVREVQKTAVPRLRFKGCEGAWSKERLSKSLRIRRGLTYTPSDMIKDGVRVLRSSNIDVDTFAFQDDDVFVRKSAVNIPFAENGQILITAANGSTNLVGKHAVVQGVGKSDTVAGGFMLIGETEVPNYVNAWMSAPWYRRFRFEFVMGGNGALGNLNKSGFDLFEAWTTLEVKEKTLIGKSFDKFDGLIQFQRRRLSFLRQLKRAMLVKMFPRPGQGVPEIRFKGFEGEWEEKRFRDAVDRKTDTVLSVHLPCVEYEDIVSGEGRLSSEFSRKLLHKKGVLFERGDVLFGKLRPYLRNQIYADFTGVAAGDFWVMSGRSVDGKFLYVLTESDAFQRVANISAGSKMPRSDWNLVSSSVFAFPTLPEQRKIAAFFRNLDRLIGAAEKKVAKLRQVKASLLERMFV